MAPPQNKRSVCRMWRFCLQLLWANIHWKRALFFFFVKNDQFRLNVPGMQYELLVKISEISIYIPRSYSSAKSFRTSIKSHITAPIFIHDCPGGVCYICEFNLVLIQLQCRTRACDHIRVECAIYVLCGTCVWYMCVVYMCVCGGTCVWYKLLTSLKLTF